MQNTKILAFVFVLLSAGAVFAGESKTFSGLTNLPQIDIPPMPATTPGAVDMYSQLDRELAHNQELKGAELSGIFEGIVYDSVRRSKEIPVKVAFMSDNEGKTLYAVTDLFMDKDKELFLTLAGHAREALYFGDKHALKQAMKLLNPAELSYKPDLRMFSGVNLKQQALFPYRRHERIFSVVKHVSGKLMVSLYEWDENMLYERGFCGILNKTGN